MRQHPSVREPRFHEHRRAREVLALLRRTQRAPRRSASASHLLLSGPSGSGKTSILEEFARRHPPTRNAEADHIPVVFLDTPPLTELRQLLDYVLHHLNAPSSRRFPTWTKVRQLGTIFARTRTRILILDDINHALLGHERRAAAFLEGLLSFAAGCGLSLVLSATGDRVPALIEKHPSLRQKIRVVFLGRLELTADFERACRALARFHKVERKLSPAELHRRSEGLIGLLAEVFEDAYQAGRKAGVAHQELNGRALH
jgi:DNA polymerase III delta prime subunit